MESANSVNMPTPMPTPMDCNDGVKGPSGYRFLPTDEELLEFYLSLKVYSSWLLPAHIIPECDVFNTHPRDLPGDPKEKRHFFTKTDGIWNASLNGCIRGAGSFGYWKAATQEVTVTNEKQWVIGMKTTFLFHEGIHPHGVPTFWVMSRYRLVPTPPKRLQDWLVSCIYEKRAKAKEYVYVGVELEYLQPASSSDGPGIETDTEMETETEIELGWSSDASSGEASSSVP